MAEQIILKAGEGYGELDDYLRESGIRHILLVCGKSILQLDINGYFEGLERRTGIKITRFSSFQPNPLYESVKDGVEIFHRTGCDSIIAVGGGSAMDVAKCIKLYSNMDSSRNYLEQAIRPNNIKLIAVPTTAGTGSEATRFAVIYYKGEKQSVADDSCIPSAVLVDPTVLKTLPDYQRKSTMLDAFCHAIESFWSVNSTEESRELSKQAVQAILRSKEAYLNNEDLGNAAMLEAANLAGKAINITQTTAGHALCYKLTSLYGIAHGHAAALCVSRLWPYMLGNLESCVDLRGKGYLESMFKELAGIMGCASSGEAAGAFQLILDELRLPVPKPGEKDFQVLRTSVNPVRMKNNPIVLNDAGIETLYQEILSPAFT